jgi:hypothetical protein
MLSFLKRDKNNIMKVAFVCSGRADNLKYLKNNRTLVESTLRNCGWEVVSTSLSDMGDLNKHLQEYTKNTIDEFIFYYTGHGDVSNQQQVLKLQLDNSKVMINDIIDSICEFINPKKQAIILDACYSGTLKGLNLNKNIEFLFSSQAREQSYESKELEHSVFSYYFCEAIVITKEYTELDSIGKYINLKNNRQESLPVNIGGNPILFSKGFKNYRLKKKEKTKNVTHALYIVVLFFSIWFFISENNFFSRDKIILASSNEKSTLTKILLEDRVNDKKELKNREETRIIAEKEKSIAQQKYRDLSKSILLILDKREADKVFKQAAILKESRGLLYSLVFLENNYFLIKEKNSENFNIEEKNKQLYKIVKVSKKDSILIKMNNVDIPAFYVQKELIKLGFKIKGIVRVDIDIQKNSSVLSVGIKINTISFNNNLSEVNTLFNKYNGSEGIAFDTVSDRGDRVLLFVNNNVVEYINRRDRKETIIFQYDKFPAKTTLLVNLFKNKNFVSE